MLQILMLKRCKEGDLWKKLQNGDGQQNEQPPLSH